MYNNPSISSHMINHSMNDTTSLYRVAFICIYFYTIWWYKVTTKLGRNVFTNKEVNGVENMNYYLTHFSTPSPGRKGRQPSTGTDGGPGGNLLDLWSCFNKYLKRNTRRTVQSISVKLILLRQLLSLSRFISD